MSQDIALTLKAQMDKVQRRVEATTPQFCSVRGGFCRTRGSLTIRHRVLVNQAQASR